MGAVFLAPRKTVFVIAPIWYYQNQAISGAIVEECGLEQRLQIVRINLRISEADDYSVLEEQLGNCKRLYQGPWHYLPGRSQGRSVTIRCHTWRTATERPRLCQDTNRG